MEEKISHYRELLLKNGENKRVVDTKMEDISNDEGTLDREIAREEDYSRKLDKVSRGVFRRTNNKLELMQENDNVNQSTSKIFFQTCFLTMVTVITIFIAISLVLWISQGQMLLNSYI